MEEPNSEPFWKKFFLDAEINENDAAHFAKIFVQHEMKTAILSDIVADDLRSIGIVKLGQIKLILKHAAMMQKTPPTESSKEPFDSQGDTLKNAFSDLNIDETLRKIELLEQIKASISSTEFQSIESILKNSKFPEAVKNFKALIEVLDELKE